MDVRPGVSSVHLYCPPPAQCSRGPTPRESLLLLLFPILVGFNCSNRKGALLFFLERRFAGQVRPCSWGALAAFSGNSALSEELCRPLHCRVPRSEGDPLLEPTSCSFRLLLNSGREFFTRLFAMFFLDSRSSLSRSYQFLLSSCECPPLARRACRSLICLKSAEPCRRDGLPPLRTLPFQFWTVTYPGPPFGSRSLSPAALRSSPFGRRSSFLFLLMFQV